MCEAAGGGRASPQCADEQEDQKVGTFVQQNVMERWIQV